MKRIKTESPNNRWDNSPTRPLMSPSKASRARNSTFCWVISQRAPMEIHIAKAISWFSQPEDKALMLKTPLIYVNEHREVELVPTSRSFIPTDWHSWCWKILCTLPEVKDSHQRNPATSDQPVSDHQVQWWHRYYGSSQPLLKTGFKAYCKRRNS